VFCVVVAGTTMPRTAVALIVTTTTLIIATTITLRLLRSSKMMDILIEQINFLFLLTEQIQKNKFSG